jgi:hypothetical protein
MDARLFSERDDVLYGHIGRKVAVLQKTDGELASTSLRMNDWARRSKYFRSRFLAIPTS